MKLYYQPEQTAAKRPPLGGRVEEVSREGKDPRSQRKRSRAAAGPRRVAFAGTPTPPPSAGDESRRRHDETIRTPRRPRPQPNRKAHRQ